MLRLAIFLVTKLLLRLYIRVHLKSDVMYTVFHLCCEKGAYLSNITKQFLDETPITDKYAILKLYSASWIRPFLKKVPVLTRCIPARLQYNNYGTFSYCLTPCKWTPVFCYKTSKTVIYFLILWLSIYSWRGQANIGHWIWLQTEATVWCQCCLYNRPSEQGSSCLCL